MPTFELHPLVARGGVVLALAVLAACSLLASQIAWQSSARAEALRDCRRDFGQPQGIKPVGVPARGGGWLLLFHCEGGKARAWMRIDNADL